MRKKIMITSAMISTIIAITSAIYLSTVPKAIAKDVTLYKNPQCGCCEHYANYLRKNGFNVTVHATNKLDEMNRKAGIANNYQSCHLTMIDNYTISGHIPINAVNRLIKERPAIQGITLPGMPAGSPGMPGLKSETFTIYTIGDKPSKIYARE